MAFSSLYIERENYQLLYERDTGEALSSRESWVSLKTRR